jgi:hypothetical protein
MGLPFAPLFTLTPSKSLSPWTPTQHTGIDNGAIVLPRRLIFSGEAPGLPHGPTAEGM